MNEPVDVVDARTDRVAQGVTGITLLAAYVFRVPWVVPVLGVLLAVGALIGPKANALHAVFERGIAPRVPGRAAVSETASVHTVRAQDGLAAVILLVASLAFVLGIGLVGWILAIVEAVIAIVVATTGFHIADRIRRKP